MLNNNFNFLTRFQSSVLISSLKCSFNESIDSLVICDTSSSLSSKCLPYIILFSPFNLIPTEPVYFLASFKLLWLTSIVSTMPIIILSFVGMQIGVYGFKTPDLTSTPNIIGSFLLKTSAIPKTHGNMAFLTSYFFLFSFISFT